MEEDAVRELLRLGVSKVSGEGREEQTHRKVHGTVRVRGRDRIVEIKTYWHKLFHRIWESKGITEERLLASLCASPMLSLGSPGRSGSALFVAHSRTLLVKTLPHDELKHFCQVFEDYAQYIVSNAASLLPVFLGLFRFRSGTVTMYVMVTPTVYPVGVSLQRLYDLKGSSVGREATDEEKRSSFCILKDNDFLKNPLPVRPPDAEMRARILQGLQADVQFLASQNLMDYSLLVAVVSTSDSGSTVTGDASLRVAPLHVDQDSREYYVGVIDILCPYALKKVVARAWKTVVRRTSVGLSTVPPNAYGVRFAEFVERNVIL